MKKSLNTLIFLFVLFFPVLIFAQTSENKVFSIRLDKETIAKGYTVTAFEDAIKLSLVPGILSSSTPVEVIELHEELPMPWSLDRVSSVYQFEFKNKAAYDDHKPFYIQLDYEEEISKYKQVFFYDKNFSSWRPLPTKDFPEEQFVRSLIHLPYARIAVFSFPDTLNKGKASWYAYKGGLFAASPDFPKGSRLRVTNLDNDKFVDVEINDYGPDRSIFPDRPIDLDKLAFAKIADLSEGIINVSIEPLEIVADDEGYIMGVHPDGVSTKPEPIATSSIIIDANTGEVLFEQDVNKKIPLASLTKIISIYTYLTVKDDLDEIVTYSSQDAQYNYEWCKPWESAELELGDGEKLTAENLVYSALVGSANNAVETLVRNSGLSRAVFIQKMNDLVASWGATSTNFIEPTGLAPLNYTTAHDYAIIAKNVFANEFLASVSVTPEYEFDTLEYEVHKRIRNTNQIIKQNLYNIEGSKTGYLDEALYCLVTKVKISDTKSVIVVTFGSPDRATSFRENEKLIKYSQRI